MEPHRAPAEGAAFIADTGHDADRIRANVRNLRMKPVIHSNPSRKRALPLDRTLYRLRYRVECFFHDLKHFRAVATRHDKTATSYLAVLHVASMLLWLRSSGTAPSPSPPAAR
ncbi:transposase [Myxococcus virescens]|uniref:transposase n=1 Tax=Myxococcus virescens TaxID=83456 RepID=UPI003DA5A06E